MLMATAVVAGHPFSERPARAEVIQQARLVPVGPGFAGGHVNATSFNRCSLVSVGEWQLIAYYNEQQKVTVARRRLDSTAWEIFPTSFTAHNITDPHDVISIAVDGRGYLHASWGMHANPLRYARSVSPVTGKAPIVFGPETKMTGQEDRVTYPEFYLLPDGGLLYMFREGGSGDGDLYLNRYDPRSEVWAAVHADASGHQPFIKGRGWSPNYNAYPNNLVFDEKQQLHIVWTWRYNHDSPAKQVGYQTNHNLCYARSPDFGKTWTRMDGTSYALPITEAGENGQPASAAEVAVGIPEGHSLINTTSLAIDGEGRPVIATWWAPGASAGDHTRQYMLVWHDGKRWQSAPIGRRGVDYDPDHDGKSDPIPESWLYKIWMSRPIVVVDRQNRVIVVFNDYQRDQRITAAWSMDRIHWQFVDLDTASIGSWEPTYDLELWRKQNKLHMLHQPLFTSVDVTTVSVLEWDVGRYLH